MNLKALLGILVIAALMATVAFVSIENQGTLSTGLTFPAGATFPVYMVVMGAFVTGFLLAFMFALVRSSMVAWGRWRVARGQRFQTQADELYAQALVARLGGRPGRAEELFRKVLERNPRHRGALMGLGTLLRESGQCREAADLHREAARSGDGSAFEAYLELAADHEADGDSDRAVKALEQAVEVEPKQSLTARHRLRQLHIRREAWSDALAVHNAIAGLPPARDQDPERERMLGQGIRYQIALQQLADGRVKEADKELKQLVKQDPTFVPAALALGRLQLDSSNSGEGIKTWIRGFEASGNPVFLSHIEEHFLSREDPNAAIETLRGVAEASGDRTLATFYLGKIYLRLEMIDEAEATFAGLGAVGESSPTVLYYQGRILYRRGQYREAADVYRQLIRGSGLLELHYLCSACEQRSETWFARCPRCGAWSTAQAELVEDLGAPVEPRPALLVQTGGA